MDDSYRATVDLFNAIKRNSATLVRIMLNNPATNPNTPYPGTNVPPILYAMAVAVETGQTKIVELLTQHPDLKISINDKRFQQALKDCAKLDPIPACVWNVVQKTAFVPLPPSPKQTTASTTAVSPAP